MHQNADPLALGWQLAKNESCAGPNYKDGCFGRAHLLGLRLIDQNIEAKKIYVVKKRDRKWIYPPPYNNELVKWGSHVSVLIGDGEQERVLYAVFGNSPLLRSEWLEIIGYDSFEHDIKISSLNVYNPFSSTNPLDSTLTETRMSLAYSWWDVEMTDSVYSAHFRPIGTNQASISSVGLQSCRTFKYSVKMANGLRPTSYQDDVKPSV